MSGLREYLKRKGAKTMTEENCPALAEYSRAMREEVIPAIERDIRAQRRAAHFARLGIPDPAIADTHPKDGDVKQAPLVSGGGAKQSPIPGSEPSERSSNVE